MYQLINTNSEGVAVPRLVFTKLTAAGGNDARFRVALYMVAAGEGEASAIAAELHIPVATVEQALQYWEGAGLLQKQQTPTIAYKPAPRRRLTSVEAAAVGENDPVLTGLLQEIQLIFGGIVSQSDLNIFSTLYVTDKIPADLILLAASHFVSSGKTSARYIEKTLLAWRREGITDCAGADYYLQTLARRQRRENEVAALMGQMADGFTVSEKKRIAKWYEDYAFDLEMINYARLCAGAQQNNVKYVDAILRQWYNKGYHRPKDVQAAEGGSNAQVQSEKKLAPEDDLLLHYNYTPQGGGRRQ